MQWAVLLMASMLACPFAECFRVGSGGHRKILASQRTFISESQLYQSTAAQSSSNDSVKVSTKDDDVDDDIPKNKRRKTTEESTNAKAEDDRPTAKNSTIQLEMPWSESQEWALRDKLSRFTVQLPVGDDNTNLKVFVLWRNFVTETPELAGYPTPFLIERLKDLWRDKTLPKPINVDLRILPFLDAFAFETKGGLTGSVYGVQGVADGTRIQTTPVGDVQETIPKGFVRTADGSVIYELGQPTSTPTAVNEPYKLPEFNYSKGWQRDGKEVAAAMISSARDMEVSSDKIGGFDSELVQLGGLTALFVTGALAAESLSHHLTVNVFWV